MILRWVVSYRDAAAAAAAPDIAADEDDTTAFSSRASIFCNFINSLLFIAISFGLHKASFKSPDSISTAPAAGSTSFGRDCGDEGGRGGEGRGGGGAGVGRRQDKRAFLRQRRQRHHA